jgi:transcriptional regulator with XRE-family HTH domain
MSSPLLRLIAISALRWLHFTIQGRHVPRLSPQRQAFGHRLAALRRAAGLTQQQLADKTEISRRMIAHYETQPSNPPSEVILKLAAALDASADVLLGVAKPAKLPKDAPQSTVDLRLWRKLQQLRKLPPDKRKALLQVLDGFLAGQDDGGHRH